MYATDNWYAHERKIHRDAYDVYVDDKDAEKILKKLCRHWGIEKPPTIRFYSNIQSGSSSYSGDRMRLSHDPSMGLILHEFAHTLHGSVKFAVSIKEADRDVIIAPYNKYRQEIVVMLRRRENRGTSHHGSHYEAILNRVHLYSKSKGHWKTTIEGWKEKRAAKKEAKKKPKISPEATTDEIFDAKVEEVKARIAKKEAAKDRYAKRLKYFNKLYGTKTKKANLSIGALKRSLKRYESQAADIGVTNE